MTLHYEKVKKISRQLGLRDSLTHLWFYSMHVGYGLALPFEYQHPRSVSDFIHEFHLDLHAREIILHAGKSSEATKSIKNWMDLSAFHNSIHKQCEVGSEASEDIYLTLHRIGHQQIGNFDRVSSHFLGRYWLLFNREPIASFVQRTFGMSVLEYFLYVAGAFTIYYGKPESNLIAELGILGIPEQSLRKRIDSISATRNDLRDRLIKQQRFDSSWEYSFNELALTPLIRLRESASDVLFCPRPQLLVRRLLAGAYFDLVGAPGFSDAFGDAVEALVGELIGGGEAGLISFKPTPYETSRGVRHGADWILRDSSGYAFVECKNARIQSNTKVAPTAEDVRAGMDRLASAIVQNYRNIQDVFDGLTDWKYENLPFFSVIVTLEDWNLFSPVASRALRSAVEDKLDEKKLSRTLLSSIPYLVTSVNDLLDMTSAMGKRGIASLITEKCNDQYEQYLVSSYLNETKQNSGSSTEVFKAGTDELFKEFNIRFQSARMENGGGGN